MAKHALGLLIISAFEPAFMAAVSDATNRAHARGRVEAMEDDGPDPEPKLSAAMMSLGSAPAAVPGVGIVDVSGPMFRTAPWWYDGETTGDWGAQVDQYAADPNIDSIMMLFDTPGGTVEGLDHFGERIAAAARVKPVVAQVSGMCCSAGLYAAANATSIFSGPRDIVGSIGTRMMLYDFSALFEKEGIKAIPIDTGEFKSAGAVGTKITDAQISDFQRIVDGYFADFRSTLMSGRRMSADQFKAVGDGRVWMGEDAKGLGLVDGIQRPGATLAAMIDAASSKRRAGRATVALRERTDALRAAASAAH